MSASVRVLFIAVAVLSGAGGFLFTRWQETRDALAVAIARIEAREETIAELKASMGITDKALKGLAKDRVTLANVRGAMRAAVKEAFNDETFKAWSAGRAHPESFRLLREAAARAGSALAPVRADGEGAGAVHPGAGN